MNTWEPLIIDELKSSILSNLSSNTDNQSIRKGTAVVSSTVKVSKNMNNKQNPVLITLNGQFNESSMVDCNGFGDAENEENGINHIRYRYTTA